MKQGGHNGRHEAVCYQPGGCLGCMQPSSDLQPSRKLVSAAVGDGGWIEYHTSHECVVKEKLEEFFCRTEGSGLWAILAQDKPSHSLHSI